MTYVISYIIYAIILILINVGFIDAYIQMHTEPEYIRNGIIYMMPMMDPLGFISIFVVEVA